MQKKDSGKDDPDRPEDDPFTACLDRWNSGDPTAANEMVRLVYDELRRIAAAHARKERKGHTLQTTAIVHETYLKIFKNEAVHWRNRAHFLGTASRVMRQILIDYARRRNRIKRRSDEGRGESAENLPHPGTPSIADVLAVDECLVKLAAIDDRKARVLEAHFFGGMTVDETADYVGISRTTVVRELKLAKGWAYQHLNRGAP